MTMTVYVAAPTNVCGGRRDGEKRRDGETGTHQMDSWKNETSKPRVGHRFRKQLSEENTS